MLTIKVPLKKAEKIKKELLQKKLLSFDFLPLKEDNFIYFPVNGTLRGFKRVEKKLKKKKKKHNFLSLLKKELSKEELDYIRRAHDVIGSIAIIEIPKELEKKKKMFGELLLKSKNNIKTVLQRGKHQGVYRTQKLTYLAGERTKEAEYRENGVRLKLDVEKVYFSVRLSTERKRIYKQVKKGELVLVMFSGCAPYPCVISKNTRASEIVGIEINPVAHDYAVENIHLNKLYNIVLINDDVHKIVPKIKSKFDRILMPLPKSAEKFLDDALQVAKKGTVIHFYNFLGEGKIKNAHTWIEKACEKAKCKFKILRTVKCGQFSPKVYRICVDFQVL